MPDGGYALLATNTLGSDTNTITFSGIPGTYQHLAIMGRCAVDGTGSLDLGLRFNGVSTSTYGSLSMTFINGVGIANYYDAGSIQARLTYGDFISTSMTNVFWTDIMNYTLANEKTMITRAMGNAANRVLLTQSYWANTSTVTSLSVFVLTGTRKFITNSKFWLYGIYGVT